MGNVLFWLLIVIVSGWLVYWSANLVEMFGRNERADRTLWWTRQAYILGGFIAMVIGCLVMFGVVDTTSDPAWLEKIKSQRLNSNGL